MKRLHIVGKSPDNRRLFFAQAKGAKFGSFEVPISSKLLKLVREVEESRGGKSKRPAKADALETPEDAAPATDAPAAGTPEQAPGSPPASKVAEPRRAGRADADSRAEPEVDASVRVVPRGADARRPAATEVVEAGADIPLGPKRGKANEREKAKRAEVDDADDADDAEEDRPKGRRNVRATKEPAVQAPTPDEAPAPPERPLVRPRTKRPEIPARSKLSPAEIQSLIRAGRTVRTVAQMAGTPTAWVRYLAEPVQQERMAIVANALRQRQMRARLGASAEPLGRAVALNLRSRGVSGADRVVEEGFTAVRSNGREWRLRLSFAHRGRRTSAVWRYDAQRREVTPANTLATQLGWRRPRASRVDDGEVAAPSARRAAKSTRGGSSTRSRKAAAARKSSASRKRSSSTVSARRRSS